MAHKESNPALYSAAMEYRAAGLCALPANRGEKRPSLAAWKPYQAHLPTEEELSTWFGNGCDAVCLVAGAVSGHLELIDFDRGGELFDAWAAAVPADLLARPGGFLLRVPKGPLSGRGESHLRTRYSSARSSDCRATEDSLVCKFRP